jgi:hypothetical protein
MASDVASQGGGAGPGRDRHRRARSAVRAGWRGGPSPGTASGHLGRGPEAPGRRAAAAAAQGQGIAHPNNHLGISSADFGLIRSRVIVGKGCIGWGRVS